jgi:glyoxylase-like metal-dependent hydrolase (beta-lactamase superfamily II)
VQKHKQRNKSLLFRPNPAIIAIIPLPKENIMPVETYRFQVGDLRCVVINDGYISNIATSWYYANAPEDQIEKHLRRYGIHSDTLAVPCNCLVLDIGSRRVLLDAGGGKGHPAYGKNSPDTAPCQAKLGNLMDGLKAEGIPAESIDTVILSHHHTDHVSGVADSTGKPAFPNARYFMARGEWDEFISLQIPDDDNDWDGWAGSVRFAQKKCLAIQDRIELIDLAESEVEILPGVYMIPTRGHTANHCSFEFVSGTARLVCPMDTLGHPIHAEHLTWNPEGEHSLASRRQILKRAESATLTHVFHFPFPGVGSIIPAGEGWRWQAL